MYVKLGVKKKKKNWKQLLVLSQFFYLCVVFQNPLRTDEESYLRNPDFLAPCLFDEHFFKLKFRECQNHLLAISGGAVNIQIVEKQCDLEHTKERFDIQIITSVNAIVMKLIINGRSCQIMANNYESEPFVLTHINTVIQYLKDSGIQVKSRRVVDPEMYHKNTDIDGPFRKLYKNTKPQLPTLASLALFKLGNSIKTQERHRMGLRFARFPHTYLYGEVYNGQWMARVTDKYQNDLKNWTHLPKHVRQKILYIASYFSPHIANMQVDKVMEASLLTRMDTIEHEVPLHAFSHSEREKYFQEIFFPSNQEQQEAREYLIEQTGSVFMKCFFVNRGYYRVEKEEEMEGLSLVPKVEFNSEQNKNQFYEIECEYPAFELCQLTDFSDVHIEPHYEFQYDYMDLSWPDSNIDIVCRKYITDVLKLL